MAVPSLTMAGAKLANNPNQLGGTIAIVISIIALIVGGTLLAVGLTQTPNNQPMIIGAISSLVAGVLLLGVGVWLASRKAQKSTVERLRERLEMLPQPLPPMTGTAYDESTIAAAERPPTARAVRAEGAERPPTASAVRSKPLTYQPLSQEQYLPSYDQYQPLPADAGRQTQRPLPRLQTPQTAGSSTEEYSSSESSWQPPLESFDTASSESESAYPEPPAITQSGQFAPVITNRALRAYQRRGSLPTTRPDLRKAGAELASDPEVRAEAIQIANQLRKNPELRGRLSPKQLRRLEQAERTGKGIKKFLQDNPQAAAFGRQLFDTGLQTAQQAYSKKQLSQKRK